MDESIRPKTEAELEAERVAADLAYHADKLAGGHHQRNDAQALRLQMNDKSGWFQ